MTASNQYPLYIFIDEGGDFNFSPTGTKYFTLTATIYRRPFVADAELQSLRFDLLESGIALERFHASEDRQPVRDAVFGILVRHADRFVVDSVIVDKGKTGPSLRDPSKFYPRILGYLLRYTIEQTDLAEYRGIQVITDRIPINKQRRAVEKAIKLTLSEIIPSSTPYRITHQDGRSCTGLQITDYFNWAIFRAWERGDDRSRTLVRHCIRSEFDIFRRGDTRWY